MVAYYRSRKSQGLAPPAPASLAGAGEPLAQPVGYPPEIVPDNAKEAVKWMHDAADDRDLKARAEVVVEVENARPKQRLTVVEATAAVLAG